MNLASTGNVAAKRLLCQKIAGTGIDIWEFIATFKGSIHKPPASIRFALIKHALAVTVEPFKFSPAEPVASELSEIKLKFHGEK